MIEFAFVRIENVVGKGENAGLQHFLLFPQIFYSNQTNSISNQTNSIISAACYFPSMFFKAGFLTGFT